VSYSSLLAVAEAEPPDNASVRQIGLDLHRTFPDHPAFGSDASGMLPPGQAALRRVLLALSRCTADGYCQSHNYLAAWCLLVFTPAREEDAFWTLRAVLEQRCAPDTFGAHLKGMHVELGTLGRLAAAKLPRVASRLAALEVVPSLYATDWMLCLFVGVLPTETALRVWDAFLAEGLKMWHRVALALLKTGQAAVLAADNMLDAVEAVRRAAKAAHDADALMMTACANIGSLPGANVERLRRLAQAEVNKQQAAYEKRRQAAASKAG
jgi:Rab-GTPase-TBC domain